MMLRLLHMVVLAGLFLAAADVYKIKYESTLQAEKVAKLRGEIRREQDAIANLRAEWSKLDRPDRIQIRVPTQNLKVEPVQDGKDRTCQNLSRRRAFSVVMVAYWRWALAKMRPQ